MNWPWSVLGLPGPSDLPTVKHAYAQCLKTTHPEEDPEGFQRLHEAYQAASRMARRLAREAAAQGQPPVGQGGGTQPPLPDGDGGEEQPGAQREERASGLDFESLLDRGDAGQEGPADGEEAPDGWDFEALLDREATGSEKPAGEEAGSADWDFEALLDQGDAEREELLRRRAADRLRQAREQRAAGQQARAQQEDAAWQAAFAALHAVELLHAHGDSYRHWWDFLHSSTFLNAQHNLDFVFGLEDFLTEHPLPQNIRQAIAVAYEFDRRLLNQSYLPLYQLLTGRKKPPRFVPGVSIRSRKLRRRAWPAFLLLGILAAVAIVFPILDHLEQGGGDGSASPQTLQSYLEEDFQVALNYQGTLPDKDWVYLYALADDPSLCFQAVARERRDLDRGTPGYDCNYPGMLIYRAMSGFALEQGWDLYFDAEYTDQEGLTDSGSSPPRTFVFQVPLTGAEEGIAALGTLLEQLEEESWYEWMPPDFWLYLTHEGRVLFEYDSSQDFAFNTEEALSNYEHFGVSYLWYLVEHLELPLWDLEDGYFLSLKGEAETPAGTCWWVEAQKGGQVVDYYLTRDGGSLYCLPSYSSPEEVFFAAQPTSFELPTGATVAVYHPSHAS